MPNDHNPPWEISIRRIPPAADPADLAGTSDYDSFAEAYAAETEANLINGYYTRPAMLALAGDVAGKRILDAGCGAGPLSAALRDRGAIVTGFDQSARMVELARRRLGDDADLQLRRRVDGGRPDRPAEFLAPAAARDDRRLHRGRLPNIGHQRTRARA